MTWDRVWLAMITMCCSHSTQLLNLLLSTLFLFKIESFNWPDWCLLFPSSSCSAMLEVRSSLSQSMVRFCTGGLGAEHLASLSAQPLDPMLASAARHPPSPCVPPKGMNGEYLLVSRTQLWLCWRVHLFIYEFPREHPLQTGPLFCFHSILNAHICISFRSLLSSFWTEIAFQ